MMRVPVSMETPFVLRVLAMVATPTEGLLLPAGERAVKPSMPAPEPVVKRVGTVELKKPVRVPHAVIGGVRLQRDIAAIAVAGKAAGVDVEDGDGCPRSS